ncbi:hypothetical protein ACH5RR_001522, partial [Cinchona calisaya]
TITEVETPTNSAHATSTLVNVVGEEGNNTTGLVNSVAQDQDDEYQVMSITISPSRDVGDGTSFCPSTSSFSALAMPTGDNQKPNKKVKKLGRGVGKKAGAKNSLDSYTTPISNPSEISSWPLIH